MKKLTSASPGSNFIGFYKKERVSPVKLSKFENLLIRFERKSIINIVLCGC